MIVLSVLALLVAGAGAYYWSRSREDAAQAEPVQMHLATLLLVSTRAFDEQNYRLYQAVIKEIVYVLSEERWGRAEIEWRIRQALLIAKLDTTPENFENVSRVALNIARVTVHSPYLLPWESQPMGQLAAPTS